MRLFISLTFFTASVGSAEYRVYKLGVKYDEKQKDEVEVVTTLDHLQYPTYYKLTSSQQVRLIDHWMCYGRTDDFRKYCPSPNDSSVRSPAGLPQNPKR